MSQPMPQPVPPAPTHRQIAEQTAIRLAVEKLAALDSWPERCQRLGLPAPAPVDNTVVLPMFYGALEIRPPEYVARVQETGQPSKPGDRLLALHYLLCEAPVIPSRQWITFRDFPGGAFYWQPFQSRSIQPLAKRVGNNVAALRARLTRLGALIEPVAGEGLCATFRAIGNISVRMVYRPGDDEFPASADFLYNACARHVFGAEDAAALASRICFALLFSLE